MRIESKGIDGSFRNWGRMLRDKISIVRSMCYRSTAVRVIARSRLLFEETSFAVVANSSCRANINSLIHWSIAKRADDVRETSWFLSLPENRSLRALSGRDESIYESDSFVSSMSSTTIVQTYGEVNRSIRPLKRSYEWVVVDGILTQDKRNTK